MLNGSLSKLVNSADKVWRIMNGVVCIYKPFGSPLGSCREELKKKICNGLNEMAHSPVENIVEIRRVHQANGGENVEFGKRVLKTIQTGEDKIEVLLGPNYMSNPLVIGPRYQIEDVKIWSPSNLGKDSSGLAVVGINKGVQIAWKIHHGRWLRSYIVSGKFGIATNTRFYTGKITAKSTYKSIKKKMVDRLLAALQSSHQQISFQAIGMPSTSQRAYEIASKGLVRPAENSETILYSLKCLDFDLPNFSIEMHVINESEDYIKTFIHELGMKLHSFAVCTKIRCVKYGPFSVDDALLSKHWDVQNIMDNIASNHEKLKKIDLIERDPYVKRFPQYMH